MSHYHRALAAIFVLALFGCHHAIIETGLKSSTEVIHEPFATSWIYGLVPPNTISTAAKCPHGVAKVETQRSFVNSLVTLITLGIYSPMEIKVTCAAKSSAMLPSKEADFVVGDGATEEQILQVFSKAADMAVAANKPVYVEY